MENPTKNSSDLLLPPIKENTKLSVWNYVKEDSMKYLTSEERATFFPIFLIIFIVAFVANSYAIYVTIKRKHRFIQKVCVISLALTDSAMATAYTINYLASFSHPFINWILGDFLCGFIPMVQTFGVIGSSAALVGIALDRYNNVVHALEKKWNPNEWTCIIGVVIVWIVSAGLAYPQYVLFSVRKVIVVFQTKSYSKEVMDVCVTSKKELLKYYYITVAAIIFIPMFLIFLWLYYKVAELVWKHRKPLSTKFQNKDNSSAETSTSNIKSTEESSKTSITQPKPKPLLRTKSIHVERKIRTFKIIITLMLIFIICRLPYYIMNVYKLSITATEHYYWILTFVFNGFALLNCALNPFLYTFLNPTIKVLTKARNAVNDFMCKICCCCLSNSEFDEFEKENPFIVEDYPKNPIVYCGTNPSKKKNFKVKFEEREHFPRYNQENNIKEKF